ncbi:hypothetical protein [uncultured Ruthenibacterium sp.]|uniref:hypothetical protein n=1 Tax=uncultured Ruthenibacterium sp. TaxID=1905347 RepID=UPI00349EAFE9
MRFLVTIAHAVYGAGKLAAAAELTKHKAGRALRPKKEDVFTMKKSTLIAIVAFLSAVAGALAAAFVYLRRREAELDEYEQLLFSEDFSHEEPDELADQTQESAQEV